MPRRVRAGQVAVMLVGWIILAITVFAGLADLKVDGNNCGSAFSPKDPIASYVPPAGSIDDLDFLQHDVATRCSRRVELRRLALFAGLITMSTCWWWSRRIRARSRSRW